MRAAGVTPQEVERAKNQLRARLVFENDSITNIAHQLGYFETIASWRLVASLRERIDAVTVDAVAQTASARLTTQQPHGRLVRAAARSLMATTLQRGLAPVRHVLENGAVVIAKHSPATPAVTVHASFARGLDLRPAGAERPGALRVEDDRSRHDEPDGRRDRRGAREPRRLAGGLRQPSRAAARAARASSRISTPCSPSSRTSSSHPTFPEADVQTKRGEIVTLIRQDEDNPAAVSGEAMLTALYGETHPYGWRPRGSVESVETITRTALRRFHARRIRAVHAVARHGGRRRPGVRGRRRPARVRRLARDAWRRRGPAGAGAAVARAS